LFCVEAFQSDSAQKEVFISDFKIREYLALNTVYENHFVVKNKGLAYASIISNSLRQNLAYFGKRITLNVEYTDILRFANLPLSQTPEN
jgi:hypothetical protein